jgi:ribosome-binding factor A
LHEELSAIARDDLSDPLLDGVRFTTLELSVDYKNARVRFVPGHAKDADGARTERALSRATPFLRARLAESVGLKHVPLLRFVLDRDPFEADALVLEHGAAPVEHAKGNASLDVDSDLDPDPDAFGR